MWLRSHLVLGALAASLLACSARPAPAVPCPAAPRVVAPPPATRTDNTLRDTDAAKTLEELARNIRLSPEDEALRKPKSLADVRAILRRDTIYLFADAAAFARTVPTVEGRFAEATLEFALGESQLVASQVFTTHAAWTGADLRIARASLASEGATPSTDRARLLAQLIQVVEEGNKIADALGITGPKHIARGAEVIRAVRQEAPTDPRTFALLAEYHRLRGEWAEFDTAMRSAESTDRASPPLCYLRAMEHLERHRRAGNAATALRECLSKYPKFVRAQAALVLTAAHPRAALRELNKLKAMNEDHYLVMLLEPTLTADEELEKLENKASDAGN